MISSKRWSGTIAMFAGAFHGGPAVEIFTAQGSAPLKDWKVWYAHMCSGRLCACGYGRACADMPVVVYR